LDHWAEISGDNLAGIVIFGLLLRLEQAEHFKKRTPCLLRLLFEDDGAFFGKVIFTLDEEVEPVEDDFLVILIQYADGSDQSEHADQPVFLLTLVFFVFCLFKTLFCRVDQVLLSFF